MIHVVDDDEAVRSSLGLALQALGKPARTFDSARAFLGALADAAPDLLILDLNMPEMNGAELYSELLRRGFTFPIVILTAQPNSPLAEQLRGAGVSAVLAKPVSLGVLEMTVSGCEQQSTELRDLGSHRAGHTAPAPTIFVVGARDSDQDALSSLIASLGWEARLFDKAQDCWDVMSSEAPDCFVCDLDQPEGNRLTQLLIEQHIEIPCVAITDKAESALTKQILFLGSFTGRWELTFRSNAVRLKSSIVESLLSWLRHPPRRILTSVITPAPVLDPDFRALVKRQPFNDLVLTSDLHVAAMSDRYAAATMLMPDRHAGQYLFDLFPDNPDDDEATGVAHLKASLLRAGASGSTDRMPLQRYDVRSLDGTGPFEERWWYPVNFPILKGGTIHHFVHRVQDVTRFVRLQRTHQ